MSFTKEKGVSVMAAKVIPLHRSIAIRLECSACGAAQDAACDCDAPYYPPSTMQKRAAVTEALKTDPKKSNRQIAKAAGVSHHTVNAIREILETGGQIAHHEKRIGSDGVKQPAKKKTAKRRKPRARPSPHASDPIQEECADCDTQEQHWQRSLGNLAGDALSMRAYWSREFGKWQKFEVTSSLVTLAKQAAMEWTKLAADLAKRTGAK